MLPSSARRFISPTFLLLLIIEINAEDFEILNTDELSCYQITRFSTGVLPIFNNITEERCEGYSSSCMLVQATTTVQISPELETRGEIVFGACMPTFACPTLSCDEIVTRSLINSLPFNITINECTSRCCKDHLCNKVEENKEGSFPQPTPHAAEMCGFNLVITNTEIEERGSGVPLGTIFSPKQRHPSGVNCEWSLDIPPGFILIVEVTQFDLEVCCDHLTITDAAGDAQQISSVGTYLFRGAVTSVHFSSNNVFPGPGFSLTYIAVMENATAPVVLEPDRNNECGNSSRMAFPGAKGFLTSPPWPSNYSGHVSCDWTITSPIDMVVQLEVERFKTEVCCNKFQLINPQTNKTLSSLMGVVATGTKFHSQTNQLLIKFSTNDVKSLEGFSFKFTAVDKEELTNKTTSPATSSCGYLTNATGESQLLSSPGFPSSYQPMQNCLWVIEAPPGHYVELHVLSFELEICCDHLQVIRQGLSPFDLAIGITFVSTGQRVAVNFISDGALERKGFQISYRAVNTSGTTPTDECGHTQHEAKVGIEKYFLSPGYPADYPANLSCEYTFTSPAENYRIRFRFQNFHTEICCDRLSFFDSPANSSSEKPFLSLRGSTGLEVRYSNSSSMRAVFTSDSSVQYPGYVMAYSAVDVSEVPINDEDSTVSPPTTTPSGICGFTANATENFAHLKSPNYPIAYPNNLICVWNIFAPFGYRIELQFGRSRTESCCDIVEIKGWEGLSQKSKYSGDFTGDRYISRGRFIRMQFTSDFSASEIGFTSSYRIVSAASFTTAYPEPERIDANVCGGSRELFASLDEQKYLDSPNFPSNYSNNLNCHWIIFAPAGHRIKLMFESFNTESCCDFLRIYETSNLDVSELITSYSGNNYNETIFYSRRNRIGLRFNSDNSVQRNGFRILFYAVDPRNVPSAAAVHSTTTVSSPTEIPTVTGPDTDHSRTIVSSNCGFEAIATNVSQSLNSPNWPEPYDNNLNCEWKLTSRTGYQVELSFQSFQSELCCDYIAIENYTTQESRLNGKRVTLLSPFYSQDGVLLLRFRSDLSIQGAGFTASFREVPDEHALSLQRTGVCGYNVTAIRTESNLYSPNWPQDYQSGMDCNWTLSAPIGFQVLITFRVFNTESCCDNLMVYDGNTLIADLRGERRDSPSFRSTAGSIRLRFRSDLSLERSGFHATYVRTGDQPQVTTSASESIDGEGSGVTDIPTSTDRIRCYTGFEMKGGGLNEKTGSITQCLHDAACLDVKATQNFAGVSAYVTAYHCVPKQVCETFSCAQVRSILPPSIPFSFQNCTTHCCYNDLCNKPKEEDEDEEKEDQDEEKEDQDEEKEEEENDKDEEEEEEEEEDGKVVVVGGEEETEITSTTNSIATDSTPVFYDYYDASVAVPTESSIDESDANTTVAAPCGYDAVSSDVTQEMFSPGWPSRYPALAHCNWTITARPGKQIMLNFISLDTERCCDYLEIYSRDGPPLLREQGNTPPSSPIISTKGFLRLRFITDHSVQYGGFHLTFSDYKEDIVQLAPCGFEKAATAHPQPLYSPGHPQFYRNSLTCHWKLTAPTGKEVLINITVFDTENCCDYLKIFDNDVEVANLRGKIKHNAWYISKSGEFTLTFRTDSSVQKQGFEGTFRAYGSDTVERSTVLPELADPTVTTTVSTTTVTQAPCGFNAMASNKVQPLYSPGWPSAYGRDLDCEWILTASRGKQVKLNITFLSIEVCCEALQVFDGDVLLSQLTSRPNGKFYSSFGVLKIRFKSDSSVQREGFQMVYQEFDPSVTDPTEFASCGFIAAAQAKEQPLSSPGYPNWNYNDGLDCRWTLEAPPGKRVVVEFVDVKTEGCCDYAQVLEHDLEVGRVSGQTIPVNHTFISGGQTISVRFVSDMSINDRGFSARYYTVDPDRIEDIALTRSTVLTAMSTAKPMDTTATTCGFEATSADEPQFITSPNFPQNYDPDVHCWWRINAPNNVTYVEIYLEQMDTEQCCDTLSLVDGIVGTVKISGNFPLKRRYYSVTHSFGIRFTSDDNEQKSGFRLSYRTSYTSGMERSSIVPTTTVRGSCEYTITLSDGEDKKLTSPGWPDNYPDGVSCKWIITAPPGKFIMLNFSTFDTEDFRDVLTVEWEDSQPQRYQGFKGEGLVIMSQSNRINLTFVTDGSIQRAGFNGYVTSNANECANVVVYAEEVMQQLTTPGWPLTHPTGLNCQWTIRTRDPSHKIYTRFLEIDLACCEDSIRFYDGDNLVGDPLTSNNTSDFPRFYVSTTNSITIRMISLAKYPGTGFGLNYSIGLENEIESLSSTTTTTQETTISTTGVSDCTNVVVYAEEFMQLLSPPGWPSAHIFGLSCQWTIRTRDPDDRIYTTFLEIDLACCEDTIRFYDGNNLVGDPLTANNGLDFPRFYISTTNSITIRMVSLAKYPGTGFGLNYRIDKLPILPCGTVTFIKDTSVLQTRNYPENYPDSDYCKWILDSPFGRQIVLNITDLKTEQCCDYIQMADGSDERIIATVRGEANESIVFTSSTSLMSVTFFSDGSANDRGFKAIVTTQLASSPDFGSCGFTGVATDVEQAFHSPGYPNEYPHSTDCYWLLRSPFPKRQVELFINDFGTESLYDILQIYDGAKVADTPGLARLHGSAENHTYFVSTGGALSLHFSSDGNRGYRGFNISFRLVSENFTLGTISPQVETATSADGFDCVVGVKLSGSGIDRDSSIASKCDRGLVCARMSSFVSSSVGDAFTSVRMNAGMCTRSETCENLRCGYLQHLLPSDLRGNIEGCSVSCCDHEGVCIGQASSGPVTGSSSSDIPVPNAGFGGNVRCHVGHHISGAEVSLNQQTVRTCDAGNVCLDVQVIAHHNLSSKIAKVSIGQCIPSGFCGTSSNCELVRRILPSAYVQTILSCSIHCCSEDLCNKPTPGFTNASTAQTGSSAPTPVNVTMELPTSGTSDDRETLCFSDDVAYLPGCTLKEYYFQMTLCASVFFNEYPYEDVMQCGTNLQLYQGCMAGLGKRCATGDKPSILNVFSVTTPFYRAQLLDQIKNMSLVAVPGYEVFCDKVVEELNRTVGGVSAAIQSMLQSAVYFCDTDRLTKLATSLEVSMRRLVNAASSGEFCKVYKNMQNLSLEIFDSCNFNLLPDTKTFSWVKQVKEVLPKILSHTFVPKCLALETINSVRPTASVQPSVNFTTPDPNGCWSYNMEVMFLLDGSGSIRPGEFPQLLEFVKQIVSSIDLSRNKVGVMQYSHWYRNRLPANQRYMETVIGLGEYDNQQAFSDAMDGVRHHGYTTYTAHAINMAISRDLFQSSGFLDNCTHQVIVVITDGRSTDSVLLPSYTSAARSQGVTMYAVGIRGYRLEELQIIASGEIGNNDRVYTTSDFLGLLGVAGDLIENLEEMLSGHTTSS